MASKNAKKVYGIEIVPNAVINAIKNAKINKIDNVNFLLGSVEEKINLIKDDIDIIIIDPPRSGVEKKTIDRIISINPQKIIYISCETQKLSEDLKAFLNDYLIKKIYVLDMFSYTYHCESVCLLMKK